MDDLQGRRGRRHGEHRSAAGDRALQRRRRRTVGVHAVADQDDQGRAAREGCLKGPEDRRSRAEEALEGGGDLGGGRQRVARRARNGPAQPDRLHLGIGRCGEHRCGELLPDGTERAGGLERSRLTAGAVDHEQHSRGMLGVRAHHEPHRRGVLGQLEDRSRQGVDDRSACVARAHRQLDLGEGAGVDLEGQALHLGRERGVAAVVDRCAVNEPDFASLLLRERRDRGTGLSRRSRSAPSVPTRRPGPAAHLFALLGEVPGQLRVDVVEQRVEGGRSELLHRVDGA